MTARELMEQALYALEYASDMTKPENISGCGCPICVTITALRGRLAQPEQEPVAWTERELELINGMIGMQLHHAEQCDHIPNRKMAEKQKGWDMERVTLLQKVKATTPPQRPWVELTEPERLACYDLNPARFASAIEAKLKEKNT